MAGATGDDGRTGRARSPVRADADQGTPQVHWAHLLRQEKLTGNMETPAEREGTAGVR
jgi:hypothetical protein